MIEECDGGEEEEEEGVWRGEKRKMTGFDDDLYFRSRYLKDAR